MAHASVGCPAGASMQIVAHQDDDLLFQNPDVLHDVRSGRCVRTVYVTAGERGDIGRLHRREAGAEAAYAQMAGVANWWTTTDAGVARHPMTLVTLAGRPNISLVFMRLPQGYWGERAKLKAGTIQSGRGDISSLFTLAAGIGAPFARIAGAENPLAPPGASVTGGATPLATPGGPPTAPPDFAPLPKALWRDAMTPQDETLENLWLGSVSRIDAEDGSSTYTKRQLTSTLSALITAFQPDTIRTQNYLGKFGDGDHDDHHAAAYFAHAATFSYAKSHTFTGYLDYRTARNRQNVFGPDLTAKANAFFAYLAFDSAPCGSPPDCGTNDYSQWLKRQYTVDANDERARDRQSPSRAVKAPSSPPVRIPEGPS